MNRRLRTVAATPWTATLVIGAGLIAGYFALPSGGLAQSVYYNVISFASVGAILVGVRLHRPADRLTWWLLALGSLELALVDSVSTLYIAMQWELPFPSVIDVFYLAAYPMLFVGVARLGRGASHYLARERRLDSGIVTIGALVLLWQPLLVPYANDETLGLVGKLALIAYPVMDIAVMYIVLNAVVFGGRREPVDVLIGLAFGAMVFGDLAYDLLALRGDYAAGDPVDATWLFYYLLLGVAALHPSMATVNAKPASLTPRLWWLVMVGLASFVAPFYLLIGSALNKDINVEALAGVALVMAVLATTRMTWMFRSLRERAQELQSGTAALQSRTVALQQALLERDSLEDDLRNRAFHDPLTGLANRALLRERIEQALARSSRSGGLTALVVCDIDGFKSVNDSQGHQAGDDLLAVVAQRLTSVVRPGDTVARLGGDEFAALLDGVHDPGIANKIAERIVSVLHEPAPVGDDTLAVSASVGVVVGTAASAAEELISDADAAMYEAKTRGKDRFVVFEPAMRSRVLERLRFTTAFAGAIERSEFRLDYQPCFSLVDGRLQGFEALLRWNHPTLGLVAPLRFISLAEETGFIVPLGRWVLENACQEAMSWPVAADGSPTIAVNVSAGQLNNCDFLADVRGALALSGLPGERLVLEVTESMLIVDTEKTIETLNELKLMGIRIAIDDFGVGYSSLDQLRQLPVDFVKIDKSFVDQIGDVDAKGRSVIEAILRLARDLDLTTVAEGIEAQSQRDALSDMGCDSGQGFLLSHPLDARAAANLVSRVRAMTAAKVDA